jgi:hypothetical protein
MRRSRFSVPHLTQWWFSSFAPKGLPLFSLRVFIRFSMILRAASWRINLASAGLADQIADKNAKL